MRRPQTGAIVPLPSTLDNRGPGPHPSAPQPVHSLRAALCCASHVRAAERAARPSPAPHRAERRRATQAHAEQPDILSTALSAERRAAAQARANQPELTGYHAKRAEFEPEYDADAETLVAELEFAPSEPQVRLQPPTHPHPCRVRV